MVTALLALVSKRSSLTSYRVYFSKDPFTPSERELDNARERDGTSRLFSVGNLLLLAFMGSYTS